MKFEYPSLSAYDDDPERLARLRAAAYLIYMKLGQMEWVDDAASCSFERVCSLHDHKGTLQVETYFDGGRNPVFEQVLLDVWDILNEPSVEIFYRDADKPGWIEAKGFTPGGRFDDMTPARVVPWPPGFENS